MQARPGTLTRQDNVNIYQYPDAIANHSADEVVTIGDLHGNAIKFLHILIREGVLSLEKKGFEALAALYATMPGDSKEAYATKLQYFHDVLAYAEKKNPCPRLRLIGDDLADRGKNDLMTLWVFEKLDHVKVDCEILTSNHGAEFLKQYAHGLTANPVMLYRFHDQETDMDSEFVGQNLAPFGKSYYGLKQSITDGVVSEDNVNLLVMNHYLDKLKVLSYTIENGEINLFSHAPFNATKLEILALIFNVDYQANDVHQFASMIDAINLAFKDIVTDIDKLEKFIGTEGIYGLFDMVMNTRYEELAEDEERIPLPFIVNNIHGHVAEENVNPEIVSLGWNYINLDTNLGKTEDADCVERHYFSYVTVEPKLEQRMALSEEAPAMSRRSSSSSIGFFSDRSSGELRREMFSDDEEEEEKSVKRNPPSA